MSFVPQDQFITKWNSISYNSGQAAKKALKKYNSFLLQNKETESSYMESMQKIRDSPGFYLGLNKIVNHLSADLHPNSVRIYFSFIKDYFRKSGFRIYDEDIKQFVDFPKVIKEKKVPIKKSDLKLLCNNATPYMRGSILVLAASGMRVSEFLQLKKEDIDFKANPVEIYLRAEITKTRVDRVTYLTPQAADSFPKIKEYDEKKSLVNFEQLFSLLRKKCDFDTRYRTSNIHHITPHRFRAYFKTITSNIHGKDYAEDIIGHQGYLSTYYSIEPEERAKKYLQLIPHITV